MTEVYLIRVCSIGYGTRQAEQPLGVAAQLASNRWLAYLPAVVPRTRMWNLKSYTPALYKKSLPRLKVIAFL